MKITIHDSVRQLLPDCRLGWMTVNSVSVRPAPAELIGELSALQAAAAEGRSLESLAAEPRIEAVRRMYKQLRFDPSRYRPASEALLRRVLQGKDLYQVNSAVDVNNYCSLKYLLPFGLYDADCVAGDITYAVAAEGKYEGISGKESSTGGKPFLTDELGVFGNPTADSLRTAVSPNTRNLLSVVYATGETPEAELVDILGFTGAMLVRYCGGAVAGKGVVRL